MEPFKNQVVVRKIMILLIQTTTLILIEVLSVQRYSLIYHKHIIFLKWNEASVPSGKGKWVPKAYRAPFFQMKGSNLLFWGHFVLVFADFEYDKFPLLRRSLTRIELLKKWNHFYSFKNTILILSKLYSYGIPTGYYIGEISYFLNTLRK